MISITTLECVCSRHAWERLCRDRGKMVRGDLILAAKMLQVPKKVELYFSPFLLGRVLPYVLQTAFCGKFTVVWSLSRCSYYAICTHLREVMSSIRLRKWRFCMLPRPTYEAQRIPISNATASRLTRMTGHYHCYFSLLITNSTVSVVLENLTVPQLPRNVLVFHGTLRFITMFTKSLLLGPVLNQSHFMTPLKKRIKRVNQKFGVPTVFCNVAPYSLVSRYKHFGGRYCLHLQVRRYEDGDSTLFRKVGNEYTASHRRRQ
jgi:hypothetical protein